MRSQRPAFAGKLANPKPRFFCAGQGNVLLAGNAAGVVFPITFEGIGSALKSGILAAESIDPRIDGQGWYADRRGAQAHPW